MGKQKEGSLQERIQKLIRSKGFYCFKNHGDMTTEPGRPDIIACIYGKFVAIEVKVDNNTPSKQQGIHCRNIWRSNGVAIIVWDLETVKKFIDIMHVRHNMVLPMTPLQEELKDNNIDDGMRW